jgi:hypothetical protein
LRVIFRSGSVSDRHPDTERSQIVGGIGVRQHVHVIAAHRWRDETGPGATSILASKQIAAAAAPTKTCVILPDAQYQHLPGFDFAPQLGHEVYARLRIRQGCPVFCEQRVQLLTSSSVHIGVIHARLGASSSSTILYLPFARFQRAYGPRSLIGVEHPLPRPEQAAPSKHFRSLSKSFQALSTRALPLLSASEEFDPVPETDCSSESTNSFTCF